MGGDEPAEPPMLSDRWGLSRIPMAAKPSCRQLRGSKRQELSWDKENAEGGDKSGCPNRRIPRVLPPRFSCPVHDGSCMNGERKEPRASGPPVLPLNEF